MFLPVYCITLFVGIEITAINPTLVDLQLDFVCTPFGLVNLLSNPYNGAMFKLCLLPKVAVSRWFPIFLCLGWITALILSGCRTPSPLETTFPATPELEASQTPPTTPTTIPTPTRTATLTPKPSSTPTGTSTRTAIPSPTVTPTYAILRAKVLVRANCRYGPGWPYLYKYGLVVGGQLRGAGTHRLGAWLLVQGVGDHDNACWVKADLMDVKGDVMSVQPTYIPLPQSPYYVPPTGVTASRDGDNRDCLLERHLPAGRGRDRLAALSAGSLGLPGRRAGLHPDAVPMKPW